MAFCRPLRSEGHAWCGPGSLTVFSGLNQLIDGIVSLQGSIVIAEPSFEDNQCSRLDSADLSAAEELCLDLAGAVGDGDVQPRTLTAA